MTIAQQLNVKQFPASIKNEAGQEIYNEDAIGNWVKREYDELGNTTYYEIRNTTYYENESGYWLRRTYDEKGNMLRYEDSSGYWSKREYNADGEETRLETSAGNVTLYEYDKHNQCIYMETNSVVEFDDRPKPIELTMDEIAEKLGIDVNLLKIKK